MFANKQGRRGGQWLGLTAEEKFAKLRSEKLFEVTDLYTIADVWGWTWERQLLESEPERWSQEREVELGMQILQKVGRCLGLFVCLFGWLEDTCLRGGAFVLAFIACCSPRAVAPVQVK